MQFKQIYLGPLDKPGDTNYEIYCMFPNLYWEREIICSLMKEEKKDLIRSFTIANKAEGVFSCGNNTEAEKMCYHAIKLNAHIFDSHRVLALTLLQFNDYDTVLCLLRELLSFERICLKDHFLRKAGDFYENHETRPYLRTLETIAFVANKGNYLDVQTFALEEMLRLDHTDFYCARDLLLSCYLRLLARKKNGLTIYPERNIEDIENFMYHGFGYTKEDSLFTFSSHEYMFRFAEMALQYYKQDQKWKEFCISLEKDNKSMFKQIFNEEKDLASNFDSVLLGNSEETPEFATGRLQLFLREIVKDWPDLLQEMHALLRKDTKLNKTSKTSTQPKTQKELEALRSLAEEKLNQGRKDLASKDFMKALTNFSASKKLFTESYGNPKRWYSVPDMPFAIVTNRSTAAAMSQMWDLARLDARFSLQMKPDHIRTYDRLIDFISAFYCNEYPVIKKELQQILKEVHAKPERPKEEWAKLSKRACSLISIQTLMLARCDLLRGEVKMKVLDTGIDDLYTPINYNNYPDLPWLHQDIHEKTF